MRLQKAAAGLLSLFELKVDGQSPPEFSGTIQPVVDVAEFYTAAQQVVSFTAGNVTNAGDSFSVTVPATQMWRIRQASFSMNAPAGTAAADGIGGAVYYDPGTGGVVLCQNHTPPKVTLANIWQVTGSVALSRPILALPGSKVLFVNDRTAAGALSVVIRLLIDSLVYP